MHLHSSQNLIIDHTQIMNTSYISSSLLLLLLLLLLSSSTSQPLPSTDPTTQPLPSTDPTTSPSPSSSSSPPSGTIARISKQQIITSIPPNSPSSSSPQLFLTSPSGKYSAFLLRTPTSSAAPGGFGNDFCFIQIQDSESEAPVWESDCTPITTANACSLIFDDQGLVVFDGSNPEWDTEAQSSGNNPLESLELVDEGDMRIRDKIGELAWKASDHPRVNQRCGEPGSPGLGPALPPFAQPIGGGGNLAFGQSNGGGSGTGGGGQGAVQGLNGNGGSSDDDQQGFGFGSDQQPLVDNSPYDSGSGRGVEMIMGAWVVAGLGFALGFGF